MSISGLLGGGDTSLDFGDVPTINFKGGGLRGRLDDDDTARITSSPRRRRQVRRLSRGFLTEARRLGNIRQKFKSAGGELRRTISKESFDQQRKSVGNLRENLARRRVLGSSFASDAVSRTEAQFAKDRGESLAVAKLKELDVSTKLLQLQMSARRNATNVKLNEMNLKAQFAANLQSSFQAAFSQAQATQQQLAFGILEGLGQGLGGLVGQFGAGGAFGEGGAFPI